MHREKFRRVNAGAAPIVIHMSDIVQKLWGFCHTLRHDGIDYGDYIEQISYLLFIKMADERSVKLPEGCDWQTLVSEPGSRPLRPLRRCAPETRDATRAPRRYLCRCIVPVHEPVNLKSSSASSIDPVDRDTTYVKGEAFEGLLEKAASEGKKAPGSTSRRGS